MGDFSTLQKRAHETEARVVARQERLKARVIALRDGVRERYGVGTLLVAGLAAGIALEQYVRLRGRAKPRKSRKVPVAGGSRVPLMAMAQFVITALLAPRPRRGAPPPPPSVTDQSMRSTPRATHSARRSGNGLLRH